MDITSHNFPGLLFKILDELASCVFVSLDFEFSGIARNNTAKKDSGPQTLQARYTEVKDAAEKYEILQIGMTLCHENISTGTYELRPYNLYLSPTIDQRLEVERNVTFQSSAASFLLDNNFSMDSFFKFGVPFLSRDEEEEVMAKATERRDRVPDRRSLDVKETDHESILFLDAVRRLVNDWLALGDSRENYLNIPPPTREGEQQSIASFPTTLNRFQKRLIHQVIELEYPSLVTIGKPAFVQIMNFDDEREKAARAQRMKYTKHRLLRQKGFRWILEAMVGGDLSDLDPDLFSFIMPQTQPASIPKAQWCSAVEFSKTRLQGRRPVIVGHNLFTDLIYFYRCFFGPLPDRVEDFQANIHELFPVLMDTKYMATYKCGSINPVSSLTEISNCLRNVPIPRTVVHPHHLKYHMVKVEHEAGYDSMMTAQIFIKLTSLLHKGHALEYSGSVPLEPRANYLTAHPVYTRPGVPLNTGLDKPRFFAHPLPEEGKTFITSIPFFSSAFISNMVDHGEMIPRVGADFWRTYGNTLRVFGTQERICSFG